MKLSAVVVALFAAATSAAAIERAAADFGQCTPTMDFQLGRPGRKADEGTFLPTDPLVYVFPDLHGTRARVKVLTRVKCKVQRDSRMRLTRTSSRRGSATSSRTCATPTRTPRTSAPRLSRSSRVWAPRTRRQQRPSTRRWASRCERSDGDERQAAGGGGVVARGRRGRRSTESTADRGSGRYDTGVWWETDRPAGPRVYNYLDATDVSQTAARRRRKMRTKKRRKKRVIPYLGMTRELLGRGVRG